MNGPRRAGSHYGPRGVFDPPNTSTRPVSSPDPTPGEVSRALSAAARTLDARAANPAGADPGEILCQLPRGDGTELRVSIHHYEGRPFVRLAPWSGGWPVKGKGATVKPRELAAVVVALGRALEQLERGAA